LLEVQLVFLGEKLMLSGLSHMLTFGVGEKEEYEEIRLIKH
jgi:hypothetical protein